MLEVEKSYDHNANDNLQKFIETNYWKVRQCDDYKAEYEECVSWRSRFHQYFVHGEFSDCTSWKEDSINCDKSLDNLSAFASIIQHEDERKNRRIEAHLANDVWIKRKEPPVDWNAELPDFIQEKQKNSFKAEYRESKYCIIF